MSNGFSVQDICIFSIGYYVKLTVCSAVVAILDFRWGLKS